MDFEDSPEEAAFRSRVRTFLDQRLERKQGAEDSPAVGSEDTAALAEAVRYQADLFDAGFACLTWPKAYGGQDAPAAFHVIMSQEEERYRTPAKIFAIQLGNLGPTLNYWGTDEQKKTHLRRMARGDDLWCQLFSEPSAGSDLAGLRTRAVRDGDEWVVDGQKIWTSNAAHARLGMLVARTDPTLPKHDGLTYFIIDMKAPGVTVAPIKTMGGSSHFCEVFFDGLRIPDRDRIGGIGDGWRVSVTTLMNERTLAAGYPIPSVENLMAMAAALPGEDGGTMLDDPSVRERIADFQVKIKALQFTINRVHSSISQGGEPGPENSIVKLVAARLNQEIASFGMELEGASGILMGGTAANGEHYLASPGGRLAGGTDEILRNILAERVIGLPPESRADKGMAFDAIPTGPDSSA
jgi:alkylation response protein AidB-like acyl-CoA dehydrogenase